MPQTLGVETQTIPHRGTALAVPAPYMVSSRVAFVMLTALALSACAQWSARHSADEAKPGTPFIVTAETTPFYRHRPQRAPRPDRQLTKDTLLTVTTYACGYSKVQLADGHEGFVANEDLTRASDTLIAAASDSSSQPEEAPPSPPEVTLPSKDPAPELEPTPLPEQLMPQ